MTCSFLKSLTLFNDTVRFFSLLWNNLILFSGEKNDDKAYKHNLHQLFSGEAIS